MKKFIEVELEVVAFDTTIDTVDQSNALPEI